VINPAKEAASILAGGKKKPVREESGDGLDAAAEEVMSAVAAKDAGALKSALKSFVSMCSYEEEEE